MGFILGIAATFWVLAMAMILKQGHIVPESEKDASILFWITVTVALAAGGVFGWTLGHLL